MSRIFISTASILNFALGIAGIQAHPSGQGMMSGGQSNMDQGTMSGSGWGENMMGCAVMGGGMRGPEMMLIMMDINDDGALTLDEFQAMPTRMFEYLDANGDDKVDAAELTGHFASNNHNPGN